MSLKHLLNEKLIAMTSTVRNSYMIGFEVLHIHTHIQYASNSYKSMNG